MLLILEAFWGDKSYCWPSNETLAKKFGCSVSRARQILYEMEELGYIYLLPADQAKPPASGPASLPTAGSIRTGPSRIGHPLPRPSIACGPHAPRPSDRRLRNRQPPCRNSDNPPCRNSDTERVFVIVEPDAFRTRGRFARSTTTKRPSASGASSGNPRSGTHPGRASTHRVTGGRHRTRAGRIAPAAAPETPAVASPVACRLNDPAVVVEALTDGQRAFLASLTEGQRSAFDALPPAVQARCSRLMPWDAIVRSPKNRCAGCPLPQAGRVAADPGDG